MTRALSASAMLLQLRQMPTQGIANRPATNTAIYVQWNVCASAQFCKRQGRVLAAAAGLQQTNVMLVGNGGREHALAWKLSQSELCQQVFVAPGNPGTAAEPKAQNIAVDVSDHAAVIEFCRGNDVGLVMIGPEAPLVAGLADDLSAAGIRTFGPSKAAAQLEGSKKFMKDICKKYNIPTAAYETFSDPAAAKHYIQQQGAPIVVKASGLAAGKGVIVAQTVKEACQAVDDMLIGAVFGDAGSEIVVEEYLEGEEASFFALVDGSSAVALASAQDHKAVGDGDTGPNTGGMGAYSPAPVVTPDIQQQVCVCSCMASCHLLCIAGKGSHKSTHHAAQQGQGLQSQTQGGCEHTAWHL
eukprot:GHRR01024052.1.p1 GENE.GHRR01024052.1~~GHRR01024052.1.p1  ORF type:complete len:356 (+),score=104.35 GHRR01024052.1:319-1386(+)